MTYVSEQIREAVRIKNSLAKEEKKINDIISVIVKCLRGGGKIILFGNGGSAADAQHWAAEITGAFCNRKRKSLPAIALGMNASESTAIANDFGFEEIFAKPVSALANKNDVVIGISTSGNSKNVLRGLEEAKKKNCVCIGFTGKSGGKMKNLCDYIFQIDSEDTPRIQEAHEFIAHLIFAEVEKQF